MRRTPTLGRRPGSLVWLLIAVMVPPAMTLVWLGFALLRQDRVLLAQRLDEAWQRAADGVVRSLDREIAALEGPGGALPDGTVRLTFTSDTVAVEPPDALLWWPVVSRLREPAPTAFADAELLEFRGAPARALAIYTTLSLSEDRALRAGAWLRIARVHRAAGRWDAALAAYARLAEVDEIEVAGVAASLQARRAMVATLGEAGRTRPRLDAASALARDLAAGRWRLDLVAWEAAWADATAAGVPGPGPDDRRWASLAAEVLWGEPAERRGAGPRAFRVESALVTAIPSRADAARVILVLPRRLDRWREAAMREAQVSSLDLLPPGPPPAAAGRDRVELLHADATRLPWTLAIGAPDPAAITRDMTNRRRLLVAALAAMLALLAGGSYFLWRLVDRELEVARLKADFVAAVSHEFRTPLTALGHLAELLEEDDELPPEARRRMYQALGRNAERLRRLVESLLDFARLDAGRRPYDLQPLDLAPFAADVVEAFRRDGASGCPVALDGTPAPGATALADRPALGNALWNLLDNAVKYSPGRTPVRVAVERRAGEVAIAVSDEGVGIDAGERDLIFERFVRGARARELGVPGTGLGLAMVAHVMAAHGGRVELESAAGAGSTFRMVLPAAG
jgi:signal transduction histidine kinase